MQFKKLRLNVHYMMVIILCGPPRVEKIFWFEFFHTIEGALGTQSGPPREILSELFSGKGFSKKAS